MDARTAAEKASRSNLFVLADVQFETAENDEKSGRLGEAIRGYWSARDRFNRVAAGLQK